MSVARAQSYAVGWREPDGPFATGRLQLDSNRLLLEGRVCSGQPSRLELQFEDVGGVHIDAADSGRGPRALVLERRAGSPVRVMSLVGFGVLHEVADLIADAMHRGGRPSGFVHRTDRHAVTAPTLRARPTDRGIGRGADTWSGRSSRL